MADSVNGESKRDVFGRHGIVARARSEVLLNVGDGCWIRSMTS